MKEELIVIENGRIEKNDSPILKGLFLQIYRTHILGIIFDSIVERKCLLEFFKGNYSLCDGKIYIEGEKADYIDSERYFKNNITIIEKTSKLINNLHIEENIFFFVDKKNMVNRRRYLLDFQKIMEQLKIAININKPAFRLTTKERVIIELIKAYVEKKKIVVLTHITGFLKRNELDDIFLLVLKLKELGMTFVLIEPFENIVFEWTSQLVMIQHGKTVGIFDTKSVNRELLYTALIKGQKIKKVDAINQIDLAEEKENVPVLEFTQVGTSILSDIDLVVESGEVLKIYYMDDESCEHMIDLLKGERKPLSGKIMLGNQSYKVNSINQAVKKGVCFIEESPYENILIYDMNVRDNLCLALSYKVPLLWLRKRYIKSVDQIIQALCSEDIAEVKLRKLEPRILQQIAYYKWYLYAPKVVVCIKPFTETDIHLQEMTIEMISILKSRGISVIILTSNFSELYRVDGDTIFIKNGHMIDEDEVYQTLYKK